MFVGRKYAWLMLTFGSPVRPGVHPGFLQWKVICAHRGQLEAAAFRGRSQWNSLLWAFWETLCHDNASNHVVIPHFRGGDIESHLEQAIAHLPPNLQSQ